MLEINYFFGMDPTNQSPLIIRVKPAHPPTYHASGVGELDPLRLAPEPAYSKALGEPTILKWFEISPQPIYLRCGLGGTWGTHHPEDGPER